MSQKKHNIIQNLFVDLVGIFNLKKHFFSESYLLVINNSNEYSAKYVGYDNNFIKIEPIFTYKPTPKSNTNSNIGKLAKNP